MKPHFWHVSMLDVKVAPTCTNPWCLRHWLPISDVKEVPELLLNTCMLQNI